MSDNDETTQIINSEDIAEAKIRSAARRAKNRGKKASQARTVVAVLPSVAKQAKTPGVGAASAAAGGSSVSGSNEAVAAKLHAIASLEFDHSRVTLPPALRRDLAHREILFAYEYVRDFSPRDAALRAGYAEATAKGYGCTLNQKPGIRAAVDHLLSAELEAAGDPRALSINRLEQAETLYRGVYPMAHLKALELIGRHHGMWPRTVTHQVSPDLASLMREIAGGSSDLQRRGITIDGRAAVVDAIAENIEDSEVIHSGAVQEPGENGSHNGEIDENTPEDQ